MIDFDDLEDAADERAAAGDDLDAAALAALSCPASKLKGEDLSLDDLLGRSAQVTAATSPVVEEPLAKAPGSKSRGGLAEPGATAALGEPAIVPIAFDGAVVTGGEPEPDMADLYRNWGAAKPQKAPGERPPNKNEAKSKRLSLCELTPAWSPEAPTASDERDDTGLAFGDDPQVCGGLPTETTAAEVPSTQEDSSVDAEEVEAASAAVADGAAEPAPGKGPLNWAVQLEETPAAGAAASSSSSKPAEAEVYDWPARPDEAHFRILDAILPMRLEREGMTPQEVMRIWEEDWGVAYARTLRFHFSESSSRKWLNPREDALPRSPTVVTLEGKAGVLNSLALSLRQHDERLRARAGADAARRRLAVAKAKPSDFGPRIRPAATAKRRPIPSTGRGTPYARRNVPSQLLD